MERCLNDEGAIIIMVPTSTWKLLQCIMNYIEIPLQFLKPIKMIIKQHPENKACSITKNSTIKKISIITRIKKYSGPNIHGTSKTNFEEFKMFRVSSWMRLFKNNGFEITRTLKTFIYAPGVPFVPIIYINIFGICSCVGFILRMDNAVKNL